MSIYEGDLPTKPTMYDGGLRLDPVTGDKTAFGVPVVHVYLMGGFVSGVQVSWKSTGAPDWTGESYPGPGTPTGIFLDVQLG